MKAPEELAEEWANNRCPEQGPEFIVWCMCKEDFLAGYQAAQPKWISFSTQTPPIENDGDLSIKFLTIDKYGDIDVLSWDWMDWQNFDVTHWMPLPDAPKEDE